MAKMILNSGDKPSPEALSRIAATDGRPVDTSDIPEASPGELKEIARQARAKRKKRMFSLRLENATIEWWQSLGVGYTGVMARFLDKARLHPDWVRSCL
ncbi:MAG: BrnA antitoxin family protein [Treponema sp.]|jgi:uncharacterized protein (DUF4415 family)|nr:BrnA antitoxin family protein [Treponema sp.]